MIFALHRRVWLAAPPLRSAVASSILSLASSCATFSSAAAPVRRVVADGPDFRHFIVRSAVLAQYAAFFRALRGAGLGYRSRPDLVAEVRAGFRVHAIPAPGAPPMPLAARKAALAEGAAKLAALRAQLGHARVSSAGAPSFFPEVAPVPAMPAPPLQHPDDVRFRRGEGWPWARGGRH